MSTNTFPGDLPRLRRGSDPTAYPEDGVYSELSTLISAGTGSVDVVLTNAANFPAGTNSGELGIASIVDKNDPFNVKEVVYGWTHIDGNTLKGCSRVYGSACAAEDYVHVAITGRVYKLLVAALETIHRGTESAEWQIGLGDSGIKVASENGHTTISFILDDGYDSYICKASRGTFDLFDSSGNTLFKINEVSGTQTTALIGALLMKAETTVDFRNSGDTDWLKIRAKTPTGTSDANEVLTMGLRNAADGVCPLDSSTKVPTANLPDYIVGGVEYKGTWNPNDGSYPETAASAGNGSYYKVSHAGSYDGTSYQPGDWIISNGSDWEKIDNTDPDLSGYMEKVSGGSDGNLVEQDASGNSADSGLATSGVARRASGHTTDNIAKLDADGDPADSGYDVKDQDDMADASETSLATQQSIKAYVDALRAWHSADIVVDANGSGDYTSLSDGVAALSAGDTILIVGDVSISSDVTATEDDVRWIWQHTTITHTDCQLYLTGAHNSFEGRLTQTGTGQSSGKRLLRIDGDDFHSSADHTIIPTGTGNGTGSANFIVTLVGSNAKLSLCFRDWTNIEFGDDAGEDFWENAFVQVVGDSPQISVRLSGITLNTASDASGIYVVNCTDGLFMVTMPNVSNSGAGTFRSIYVSSAGDQNTFVGRAHNGIQDGGTGNNTNALVT
jgi:hypothetical protein